MISNIWPEHKSNDQSSYAIDTINPLITASAHKNTDRTRKHQALKLSYLDIISENAILNLMT